MLIFFGVFPGVVGGEVNDFELLGGESIVSEGVSVVVVGLELSVVVTLLFVVIVVIFDVMFAVDAFGGVLVVVVVSDVVSEAVLVVVFVGVLVVVVEVVRGVVRKVVVFVEWVSSTLIGSKSSFFVGEVVLFTESISSNSSSKESCKQLQQCNIRNYTATNLKRFVLRNTFLFFGTWFLGRAGIFVRVACICSRLAFA